MAKIRIGRRTVPRPIDAIVGEFEPNPKPNDVVIRVENDNGSVSEIAFPNDLIAPVLRAIHLCKPMISSKGLEE